MNHNDLKTRTRNFSVCVIRYLNEIPSKFPVTAVAKQLIRSATSIGANYREACRARSKKEFLSKLGIVLAEADESLYWLEILRDLQPKENQEINQLVDECNELVAIFTVSVRTAGGDA